MHPVTHSSLQQELLSPQPRVTTSAAVSADASAAGTSTNPGITTTRLSQTLTRFVNASWNGHHPVETAEDPDEPRHSAEDRAEAHDLWQSISIEPPFWIWPAPADNDGFSPALVWSQTNPYGRPGFGLVHGIPLTGWEPDITCAEPHENPHLSLQQCITDYEKLFNGDERLNRMVDGSIPIFSFERLFFALWASRHHLLPKRNPNNHFEVQQPNEHTADFLAGLLNPTNHRYPLMVNNSFDGVVAGNAAPHFKVGDLRIALLRWYESCPASRPFPNDRMSGPAEMELPNLELYRADIRHQLEEPFRGHFADALDTLRLRVYNVLTKRKPKWRTPRCPRPMPSQEEDPAVWRIRPDRILDHENVIFADSWGVQLVPSGNALAVILSGPADSLIRKLQKFFLSHRVQNVYWFWGRDGLSDSVHDITSTWYSKLTEHFVRWFPHVRLLILMPPYTSENDHYWSYRIRREVLNNLQDHCLNTTVICDPLDLKLQEYHEQWMLGHDRAIYDKPPWPTDEQAAEGNPSADGLRRRKTYMREKFVFTLYEHEANDFRNTEPQAAGQSSVSDLSGSGTAPPPQAAGRENASSGPSGSGTAPPTLQADRPSGVPLPAERDANETALINRLRGIFPNPELLHAMLHDVGRYLNALHQLPSRVQTPTWLEIYPELTNIEALNLWGVYKRLCYSAIPQHQPDSDAETDAMSDAELSDTPSNPSSRRLLVANVAGGQSSLSWHGVSGQMAASTPVNAPLNLRSGRAAVANATGGQSSSRRSFELPAGMAWPYCFFCNIHGHWSSDCPANNLQARWALVEERQLCQQCLRAGHLFADCSIHNRRCLHCSQHHHAALCSREPGPSRSARLSVANAAGGQGSLSQPVESRNRTSDTVATVNMDTTPNPGLGHPSMANAVGGRSPPDTSDTTLTRISSTELRQGTPRASSRGLAAPRAQDLPWPDARHDW